MIDLEHVMGKVPPDLLDHLVAEAVARVEHGQQQPLDRQRRVQAFADQVDGFQQRAQALERVVLTLQRHEHGIGRRQPVDREQAE